MNELRFGRKRSESSIEQSDHVPEKLMERKIPKKSLTPAPQSNRRLTSKQLHRVAGQVTAIKAELQEIDELIVETRKRLMRGIFVIKKRPW